MSDQEVHYLEEQLADAHRMLAAVVQAVGGRVCVSRRRLEEMDRYPQLTTWEDPATGNVVVQAHG